MPEHGPLTGPAVAAAEAVGFDVVGDVHGMLAPLVALLERLGYVLTWATAHDERHIARAVHPAGRKLVFAGDLADRGPASLATLRTAAALVRAGDAYWVRGNHDEALLRFVAGIGQFSDMITGLAPTLARVLDLPDDEQDALEAVLAALPYQLQLFLPGGDVPLAHVVHGGIPLEGVGQDSPRLRQFALWGQRVPGKRLEEEWPLWFRLWTERVPGVESPLCVMGHYPMMEPICAGAAVALDTACVFGNRLTALQLPERTLETVPAALVE